MGTTATPVVHNRDLTLGELPPTMAAWVIREDRFGEPLDAIRLQEVEVRERGGSRWSVPVMAAGVNYNNVWASLGKPVSVFALHPEEDHHIGGWDCLGVVWKVGSGRHPVATR